MTKVKQVFFSEKDQEQLDLLSAIEKFLQENGHTYSNMSRRLWMNLLWGRPLPGHMHQFTQMQPLQQAQQVPESTPPVLAPIGQVVKKKTIKKEKPEADIVLHTTLPLIEDEEEDDGNTFDSGMPML